MSGPTNEELRAELERVRKERDSYRTTAGDLMKRFLGIDIDIYESDMREVRENGTRQMTIDELIAELEEHAEPRS